MAQTPPPFANTSMPTTRRPQPPSRFLRVNRLDGDFGRNEMLVSRIHIAFVLPGGPRLGGKLAGCRIQLRDGTMWSLSDSFDEIVMALEEGN